MEIYDVDVYEFWDNEDNVDLNTFSVAAEDAEEAIAKAKKISFERGVVEEEVEGKKKPVVHKIKSVEVHQVVWKQSLDG